MHDWPHLNPIAFHLGPIAVHWYGLMYLLGFLLAWTLGIYRARRSAGAWNSDLVTDLLFYCALGVIIGGRVGYMILYNLPAFVHNPLSLFRVWDGGMSFHGGFIGVLVGVALFCRKKHKKFFEVTDFIAPLIPLGLGAGRIGNFINGELWGRVTTMPWGLVYPNAGPLPRHPSELYEFLLEGILLFVVLWCYSMRPKPRMAVSGLFLIIYACARIFCEFFRRPDAGIGYIAWNWLTLGQIYSLPMLLLGMVLMGSAYRRKFTHTKKT